MKNTRRFGVGVDVEDIGRFAGLRRVKDAAFLRKIFTVRELDYCFSKKDPAPHLAARFSAKEALVKALHGLGVSRISLAEIEIVNGRGSVPRVVLKRDVKALEGYRIEVSLSHSATVAIAFALILLR